jgi:hypothetical protein
VVSIAVLASVLRASVVDLPLERDEGGYAYIAQRWLLGELPYRDAFDQKPPAVFAFYALVLSVAGESPAALRWAAHALILCTLAGLVGLGHRLQNAAAGFAAAALAAFLTVAPAWLGNSVNTELLALAPLTLGAFAALRASRREAIAGAFWSGLLGGIAVLCKPVVVPMVGYTVLTAAAGRGGRLARLLAACVGVALPAAAVAAGFAAAGALRLFLDATVLHNLAYASQVPLAAYPRVFWRHFEPTLATHGPIYLAAAAAPLLAVAKSGTGASPSPRAVLWTVGWLLAALVAVSSGGYFRHHYFMLAAPPLALLAGIGLSAAADRITQRAGARHVLLGAALAAIIGHGVAREWWYYRPGPVGPKMDRFYGRSPFPEAPSLGRWIAERSRPEDTIFIYGSEPELLFHSHRKSASRYIYVYPLNQALAEVAERQREALAEIRAARPRFVVGVFIPPSLLESAGTPADLREGLRALVEHEYDLAAVVPLERERTGRVVEGAAARALWNERPLWDGGPPWAAFVVWQRRPEPP